MTLTTTFKPLQGSSPIGLFRFSTVLPKAMMGAVGVLLSVSASAARRLPNGNTFIDEGQSGRLFQVTRDGDIVWEYVNPYFRLGKDQLTGREATNNSLYRGQPVSYEWVPAGTPHTEKAVIPPELSQFRIPPAP